MSSLGPEVELRHWEIRPGWIHPEEGPALVLAIKKLMWAGRALDVVALTSQKLGLVEASEILGVLDQALQELNQGNRGGLRGSLITKSKNCLNGIDHQASMKAHESMGKS